MTAPLVLKEIKGPVCHLTLNSPKSLNSLSDAMMSTLHSELDSIAHDADIRVVILSGNGKAFCAGHDLKEITAARAAPDGGDAYFRDLFSRAAALMLRIQSLPQPVIAQVHGVATAGGCQLVASCDMAVAPNGTRFGVNGVNIGLFCSTPMVALSRNVPRKTAFELLTTGRFMSAEEAADVGLINKAVEPDDLEAEVAALAELVSEKLSAVVRTGKLAFYEQLQMPVAEAYDYAGTVMAENMILEDTAEGIAAFLERREPDWKRG